MIIGAAAARIDGILSATGQDGEGVSYYSGGGGGGAGGTILLRVRSGGAGIGAVAASGGAGGHGEPKVSGTNSGGDGGVGRVRIEYCDTLNGSPTGTVTTNPSASIQKLDCYIAEQEEGAPATTRLNLPQSGEHTYLVQYGRNLGFAGSGEQPATLRVPAGLFAGATLDTLVSGTGNGPVTVRLDIGDDNATGAWDWEQTLSVTDKATFTSSDLAAAFNRYWSSHGAPSTGILDVPVRVWLSTAGQLLLTNVQLTPGGSAVRALRLPARSYAQVNLDLAIDDTASVSRTIAIDIGDDGSLDWSWTGTTTASTSLTATGLAPAVNAYLTGSSGEVDVPVRIYVAPFAAPRLTRFSATLTARPDIAVERIAVPLVPPSVEADTVPITATLRNSGATDSGPLTVSFFTSTANLPETYIGSAFVPNVPKNDGTADAGIIWNTLGFTGPVTLRAVVDPFGRLAEANKGNNAATASVTVLSRPDLVVAAITLDPPEPVRDEPVSVTVVISNTGQTTAITHTVALFDGSPSAGNLALDTETRPPLAAGASETVHFPWTPSTFGPHQLFVWLDRPGVLGESNAGNNQAWLPVYIGFGRNYEIVSGSANDQRHTVDRGYGFVTDSEAVSCTSETLRRSRSATGELSYVFDHLLPGHYYHLDLTFSGCDRTRREQLVFVDARDEGRSEGMARAIAGPIDLPADSTRRLSLLLDPVNYAKDNSITVTISETRKLFAAIAQISLRDVDYRYVDAGDPRCAEGVICRDRPYPSGEATRTYGYLGDERDTAVQDWGTLPAQNARVAYYPSTSIRYQLDGLDGDRQYRPQMGFFHRLTGEQPAQRVSIDTQDVIPEGMSGPDFTVPYSETVTISTTVLLETYRDGSIVITITRKDGYYPIFVNEIALEEITLAAEGTSTPTPTDTLTATATPTLTETPTATPTITPSLSPTDTPTPPLTGTHTPTPTDTLALTITPTDTAIPTDMPTETPTNMPTVAPTPTTPVTVRNVRVSSITDTAAVITWETDRPASGAVRYAITGTLDLGTALVGADLRPGGFVGDVHHVQLDHLTPETVYQFVIETNDQVADGEPFSFATGPTLSVPGAPNTVFGRLLDESGVPAGGCLAFVRLRDGDGQDSGGDSSWLVALVDGGGEWQMELTARTADLTSYFVYQVGTDQIVVEAQCAARGTAGEA